MDVILSNQSLANLVFTNLDDTYDIVNFSEINKCCNDITMKVRKDLKNQRIDEIENEYDDLFWEYSVLFGHCSIPGNFIYYVDDCKSKLCDIENFLEENMSMLVRTNKSLVYEKQRISELWDELEEYEWCVYEETVATFDD